MRSTTAGSSTASPPFRVGLALFIRDETKRRRAESRLDTVLNSIGDHLACYDRNWRFTYVNEAAAATLGLPVDRSGGSVRWRRSSAPT